MGKLSSRGAEIGTGLAKVPQTLEQNRDWNPIFSPPQPLCRPHWRITGHPPTTTAITSLPPTGSARLPRMPELPAAEQKCSVARSRPVPAHSPPRGVSGLRMKPQFLPRSLGPCRRCVLVSCLPVCLHIPATSSCSSFAPTLVPSSGPLPMPCPLPRCPRGRCLLPSLLSACSLSVSTLDSKLLRTNIPHGVHRFHTVSAR